MSDNYDFLKDSNSFTPPEPEFRLKQFSEKLVFSTRMYPDWVTAALAIFKKKYPDSPIDNSSKLLQLIIQDYIKQNYQLIGENLPPTDEAINILIRKGFVNPDSKSQFRKLSKANQKSTEYEAEALSSGSLKQQYEYYKNRDPEKAEEIMQRMQEELLADLEQDEEEDSSEQQDSPKEETPVNENRSGLEQEEEEDEIASPDYLDDIPTKKEDSS